MVPILYGKGRIEIDFYLPIFMVRAKILFTQFPGSSFIASMYGVFLK